MNGATCVEKVLETGQNIEKQVTFLIVILSFLD